jgi:hypothetical protein
MKGVMQSPLAQVVAVCDCRQQRREAAVRAVNRHYAEKEGRGSYRGCEGYNDFRELLARDDIDAVLVCPPDHWHGIVVTRSLAAGKDLYCEKPIGLTIAECKAIRDAVRRYGAVFQTGTQQRSDARFRRACELARGGYLGKIHTIEVAVPPGGSIPKQPPAPVPPGFDYDMWTGPARMHPFDERRCEWLAMYWIYDYCVNFLESVRARREPVAPIDAGHRASCLGNVAEIALRLGRKVTWDPATEQFVGDDEANRLQHRAMREPWGL